VLTMTGHLGLLTARYFAAGLVRPILDVVLELRLWRLVRGQDLCHMQDDRGHSQ
jgi:hypothetical protein